MKKNEINLQIGKFTSYKMKTEVIYYFIKSDLYICVCVCVCVCVCILFLTLQDQNSISIRNSIS